MSYTLGFVGVGNMGGALAEAAAKRLCGERIAVCDRDFSKCERLQEHFGVVASDADTVVSNSRFVILGVKPQMAAETLASLKEGFNKNPDAVLVSMAAGLSLASLRAMLEDSGRPLIRIMPNTPVRVGEGMIQFACDGVSSSDKADFVDFFSAAGRLDEIDEEKIDAASALSGCGPAFVCLFAEALADAGLECGLTRDKAILYAAETLVGTGKMIETFGHVGDLKDAVCSPGGTTIAGVHALEKGGLRGTVMDAVLAAYRRTKEL